MKFFIAFILILIVSTFGGYLIGSQRTEKFDVTEIAQVVSIIIADIIICSIMAYQITLNVNL